MNRFPISLNKDRLNSELCGPSVEQTESHLEPLQRMDGSSWVALGPVGRWSIYQPPGIINPTWHPGEFEGEIRKGGVQVARL